MSLPTFAPFPSSEVRRQILPQEWTAYLDSCTSLADLYLRLDDEHFNSAVSEATSLSDFLICFFHELAKDGAIRALDLRRKCFLLLHRVYSGDHIPVSLTCWSFLSDICRVFSKSEQFRTLLDSLWKRKGSVLEKTLGPVKSSLIKHLDSRNIDQVEAILNSIVPVLRQSTDAGIYMLTGSDFLDALIAAYPKVPGPVQAKLTTTAYLGLTALLAGPKPRFSLLSDHLYNLKTNGQQHKSSGTTKPDLVADLVTNTPFLNSIRHKAAAADAARVGNFAAELAAFQKPSIARPKRLIRRRVDKGKAKAVDLDPSPEAMGDAHIRRMGLISQIQDLFPDLGSGFVAKLLHEYGDNAEEVIAQLLEGTLPPHLAAADKSEQLSASIPESHMVPRSTPPAVERRNVFDDDEFDRLQVDTSRLHIGRKNQQLTADKILSDRKNAPSKSAILSALAAFDSDDDERDDTYDVEDVGGTVDSAIAGTDEAVDKNEEVLFRAYSSTTEIFRRDGETRRSKARAVLKDETGMTDEAIEGWGVMIGRDPKRLRRLEVKFSAFSGEQTQLASTAWRDAPVGSEGEEPGEGKDGHRGGRGGRSGRGRGRGRGRGGGNRGGGDVAGTPSERSTQVSRQRKEANKGSRANHNRRDQRAKKMARGGLAA